MFRGLGYHVRPSRGAKHTGNPLNRQVVGFSRAACPNDLACLAPDQCGDFGSRVVNCYGRGSTKGMPPAGGIAKLLAKERQHGLKDERIERRRRTVIEVNHSIALTYDRATRNPRRMLVKTPFRL